MDRLLERLTPTERFQIAVAAFGRGDLVEVDRLNDSAAYRGINVQEPAYFERLQKITWLALYFTVQARDIQLTVLAVFSAMIIHLVQSDSRRHTGELSDEDDAKFDELVELIEQRISRLKALHAAWVEFCSGLGLAAGDIDKMIGLSFMGRLEQLEPIQKIALEVTPDAEFQRDCLDVMRRFWKTKLEDRYAALG